MTVRPILTVRVFRAGVLARFGHDLQFQCDRFVIERCGERLWARVCTHSLSVDGAIYRGRVRADLLGDDDRCKIHHIARQVLRSDQHPEARFEGVVRSQDGDPAVDGALTLLGQRLMLPTLRPREGSGRIVASLTLRPSRWGIEQVRGFGGALRLEDRIDVMIDLPSPHSPASRHAHTWRCVREPTEDFAWVGPVHEPVP